jgi:glycosyltransferase involved in cell wall biosynthesis
MLSWEFEPHIVGGLGRHVSELVPALGRAGVEVHLVTPRFQGGPQAEALSPKTIVYRAEPQQVESPDFFTGVWRTNVTMAQSAREILQTNGPFDVLHCHDWLTSFAAVDLKHQYRLPLVATIHATEKGRGRGKLHGDMARAIHNMEWWLTYEAWRIICTSGYMASEVHSTFQVPFDKIDIIPNGVDASEFDALEGVDLADFRSRYALPEEKIVLYVGRMVQEKGVYVLLEAASKVLAEYPAAKFVLAGTGPELEGVRTRAQELGLGPKAYIVGYVDDDTRNRLYKVADVAVFPSLYEPFGIVALEAMAARCPVVASNTGGLSEVIENHFTGILVTPGDSDSLAWGILHTLRRPDWSRARVENAYHVVKTKYNWDLVASSVAAVYQRVVRERAQVVW